MVMPSLFLWLKGVARTRWPSDPVNPGLSRRTGRSDRHAGGCHKNLGPADESIAGQPARASADSRGQAGPRLPTLRPNHRKTTQAGPGPEALSTSSLRILRPMTGGQLRVQQACADAPSSVHGRSQLGSSDRPSHRLQSSECNTRIHACMNNDSKVRTPSATQLPSDTAHQADGRTPCEWSMNHH